MRAAIALFFFAWFAACDLSDKHGCVVDGDCDDGRQCVDGTCRDPSRICAEVGCALFSLSPSVAASGQTLAIEGTFGSDLSITFPGGVAAQPTTVTAHRALVTVPDGATAGDLSATSGGQTLGPLSFRTSSFVPRLIDSLLRPDQASYARRPPQLTAPRTRFSLIAAGGSLYALGGEDAAGAPLATLERSRMEADGALSIFTPFAGVALSEPRAGAAVLVAADRLFVVGGDGADGMPLGTVESATLASGTLGAFAAAGNLATKRSDAAIAIVGDSLYVVGGRDSAGMPLSTVEVAHLDPDGTLDPFTAAPPLSVARAGASCAVVGGALFVAGGEGTGGTLASVEELSLAFSDGDARSAFAAGPPLESPRSFAAPILLGDTLYLVGGESAGQSLDSIEQLQNGAFSTFRAGLVTARSRAALAVAGNFVYVAGGRGPDGAQGDLERLAFDDGATSGPFVAASPLPQPTGSSGFAALGPWFYSLGGKTDLTAVATVARAPVDAAGQMGDFANYTALVTPRLGLCTAVIDQSLYVIGGSNVSGAAEPTIEVATITDDGNLGAFQVVPLTLTTPRLRTFCIVIGGWLYVVGGQDGAGNNLTSIERAPIVATSTLGSFTTAPVSLNTPRRSMVGVIDGQRLFITAGTTMVDTALSISEQFGYDADGTLHPPTAATELLEARREPVSFVAGGSWIIVGGYRAGNSLTTIEGSAFKDDGNFPTFQELPNQMMVGRDAFGGVVLGNFFYAVGGANNTHVVSGVEQALLQD